jgi:hypothetical protein
MSELTRRAFVTRSAGTAAGMTAIGALAVQASDADAKGKVDATPVVAYIANPRSGEISVMTGKREVTVRDRKLAAQIARAAK